MLRRLHMLKDLSDLSQPAVSDLSSRIILKAKTSKTKMDSGSCAGSSKVKRTSSIDAAGPSTCTQQSSDASQLCNGEADESSAIGNGKGRLFY